MKKSLFFILLFSVFYSCNSKDSFKLVKKDNKFSLDVLDSLFETKDLNEDASLQYQNIFKELYIIVIDETITEVENAIIDNELMDMYSLDFDGYTNLILDNYKNSEEGLKLSEAKDTIINGLPSKLVEMEGTVEKIDVYYYFALVKGENSYYQIMTWTLLDKKKSLKETMETMLLSFKDLKSKRVRK